MLVGVITGTYSSIFIASPILVDFAKTSLWVAQKKRKTGCCKIVFLR